MKAMPSPARRTWNTTAGRGGAGHRDVGARRQGAEKVAADHATTDDLIKRVVAYYTVKNVLWPMPA